MPEKERQYEQSLTQTVIHNPSFEQEVNNNDMQNRKFWNNSSHCNVANSKDTKNKDVDENQLKIMKRLHSFQEISRDNAKRAVKLSISQPDPIPERVPQEVLDHVKKVIFHDSNTKCIC